MRRRRRPLRALLLVALASGAAFYVLEASLRAEREYAAFVHQLASGQESRVLESSFERGWLRSRASTSLEVAGGAGLVFRSAVEALGAQDVRSRVGVTLVNEIEHGLLPLVEWARGGFHGAPILARVRSTLEVDQESQLALSESVGKLPPIEAETLLRTGEAETRFSMRPENLKARTEGFEREGRWAGLEGEIDATHGFRRISGRVSSPGLDTTGPERRIALRDLVWEFDLPAGELPVGRMTLAVAALEVESTNAGAVPMAIERLRVEGDSRLSAGSFGAELAVTAAAVSLGEQRWGPGSMQIALRDVDGQALRRLRHAGLRLASHAASEEGAQLAKAVDTLEALPSLIAAGPHVAVEQLELTTPHGPVTATARFALAPATGDEDTQPVGSLLRGALDVRMPAAVLDAVADARARGELAAEGVSASDAGLAASARERRQAWIASLRRAGRLADEGALRSVQTLWGAPEAQPPADAPVAQDASPAAPEAAPAPPAARPQEAPAPQAAQAAPARRPPPPQAARPAPAPPPPAAPAPAAPAPAPAAPANASPDPAAETPGGSVTAP
jgi:uncharacterized protein YdgA (DUF945 family)